MVMATQNPVEMDGTYRLPEAQLDRFLMRVAVGYPDAVAERQILNGYHDGTAIDSMIPVLTTEDISQLVAWASEVEVSESLQDYIVALSAATRIVPDIQLGVSPRGSVALMRAARAMALADGRGFVIPEDIKDLAGAVFAHRIIVHPEAELRGVTAAQLIDQTLAAAPVPHVVHS
jgi:MoxR-like ATPase